MKSPLFSTQKLFVTLYLVSLGLMLYLYQKGYDSSIKWKVTTQAELEEYPLYQFNKGPFEFSLPGHRLALVESFSAGPIERSPEMERALILLAFLGIVAVLTSITYLSGFWFYLTSGAFIFFLISLDLASVQFLGFPLGSKVGLGILLATFMLPVYLFSIWFKQSPLLLRLGVFLGLSGLLVLFSRVDYWLLREQLVVGGYIGFAVLTLLFLFVIAEEIVFALLFLVTRSKGGKNNEKHFTAFVLIYLGIVGIAYAKKAGFFAVDAPFFDPYVLMAISSLVALWSIKFKENLYSSIFDSGLAILLLTGSGMSVFGFMALSFLQGNDAYFQAFHYLILYTHLGFGVLFFFYIISNFVNPLIEGHPIYRIVYKEQNFPYSTARIGGLVAVAAFFFLSSNEPLKLLQGGRLNLLGAKSHAENQSNLADEYFQRGRIYAYDNHYSNYALGYRLLQKGSYKDANNRFQRATYRYPSVQSFINHSGTHSLMGETTPSLISLKNGLTEFPNESHLLNNLGLIYLDLDQVDSARKYFNQAGSLSSSNKVNYWRSSNHFSREELIGDYQTDNLAVKANILRRLLEEGETRALTFDTSAAHSPYPLHKMAYLLNSAAYFQSTESFEQLERALEKPVDASIYDQCLHTRAILQVRQGEINRGLQALDHIQFQSDKNRRGELVNEMGLITLGQQAPGVALKFFEQAIEAGHTPALFNKVIALLEMGNFELAREVSQRLAAEDSSLIDFHRDLLSVTNKNLLEPNVFNLYYAYDQYSLNELETIIEQMDTDFAKSLWHKIYIQEFEKGEMNDLAGYYQLFRDRIEDRSFINGVLASLTEGIPFEGDTSHLVNKAFNNAFDVPVVLAAARTIPDARRAHNLLSSAIDINSQSAVLLKAYIWACVDLGLVDYSYAGLEKFRPLVNQKEYLELKSRVDDKIRELRNNDPW